MKELLKQVKQYKKDSILAPVYSALEVVMEVIIPFVMALLIDCLLYTSDAADE